MAEYNVMNALYIPNTIDGDKIYSYGGYGVKRMRISTPDGSVLINGIVCTSDTVLEFPVLGNSLPCVFEVWGKIMNAGVEELKLSVLIEEYGGQPDPKYFEITGLDETGKPIYEEETT